MVNEQDHLNKLQSDMIDVQIRLGVAESDIKAIKTDLKSIKDGVSKLLWGVFGTFGTLLIGITLAIITYYLNHH